MNKIYITAASVLILLGVILAFMPEQKSKPEIEPDKLLLDIIEENRFFSVDQLADLLIKGDPSVQLIDVRTPEEYAKFALPNSVNLPLDSVLNQNFEYILNNPTKKNILYSNGTIYANQAWMLCKRLNFKNIYVLKGGVNEWFSTIIKPEKPLASAGKTDQDLYQFRLAASQFFTGGSNVQSNESNQNQTAPVIKRESKKKGGRC